MGVLKKNAAQRVLLRFYHEHRVHLQVYQK
jgi:hypothetical protein